MPTGYTRQSAAEIVTGQTVNASSFNNEFNAIQAAMDATTGHTHDGTVGGGAQISLATSVQGTLGVANGGTGATTAANARTNLGLGSIATQSAASVAITGGTIAGITDLAIGDGGTGASDAATARTNLGLGSIATQNAAAVSIGTLTTTGDVTVADRIHHAGDTDTAIRFPTNDVVSIETAGAESVRFTATGIGRNVATPTSAIHIVDTVSAAGGNGFKFADISDTTRNIELARSGISYSYNGITGAVGLLYSSNNLALLADTTGGNNSILFSVGGAIRAQLQWDGKFGIGTTTPATTLDVNGDVTITDKIIHSGDTDTSIRFPAVDTVTVETGGVERMRVTSGGVRIPSTTGNATLELFNDQATNVLVNSPFNGVDFLSTSGNTNYRSSVRGYVGGFSDQVGLDFVTYSITSRFTRMRITPSGNVGIGTTNPSDILHVESSGTSRVRVKTTTASARTDLALVNSSDIVTAVYGHDGTNAEIDYRTGNLQFKYIGVTQATLSTSGQLGIGTTPSEQLHITGNFRIGSAVQATPSGSAPLYAARAWVNFNGTGTVAIRASGNVTSITDNNTGDYTVNFTTAMPDANYSVQCNIAYGTNVAAAVNRVCQVGGTQTTSAVRVLTGFASAGGTLEDQPSVFISVFR